MERKERICICCPMGCALTAEIENGEVRRVTGNTCPRGDAYGRKEVTNPTRIVTSVVPVRGGTSGMVSVKTASDIPKGKIMECMDALRGIQAAAPVRIGDMIAENIADTGVDVIATKNVDVLQRRCGG